jgi:hypothetical protein
VGVAFVDAEETDDPPQPFVTKHEPRCDRNECVSIHVPTLAPTSAGLKGSRAAKNHFYFRAELA